MSKFVIRAVDTGMKFDLKAANGQTVATSEVYETAAACRKGIESVIKNAPRAKVEDQTRESWTALTNPKFELYEDKSGQYRFRLKARNGQVIAISEGYTSKGSCMDGIESVKNNAPRAELVQ